MNFADELEAAGKAAGDAAKEAKTLGDTITDAGRKGKTAATDIVSGFGKAPNIIQTSTGAVGRMASGFNTVMGLARGLLGKLGQLGLAYSLLRGMYDFFTKSQREAIAQKNKDLEASIDKAKDLQKELNDLIEKNRLLNEQQERQERWDSLMNSYQSQTAELQKQLEITRARAAVEAEIKGLGMQAKKYELDNRRDRGEITAFEHLQETRKLEDEELQAKHASELAEANTELDNLREQSKKTAETIKDLNQESERLDQGKAGALTPEQRKQHEINQKKNEAYALTREKALAEGSIGVMDRYQVRREAELGRAEAKKFEDAIKRSDAWYKAEGRGGNYESYIKAKEDIQGKKTQAYANANQLMGRIQEKNKTVDAIKKKQQAETDAVIGNRQVVDQTVAAKAADDFAIKEAVGTLTSERNILKEATQGLADAARIDAEEISKQAEAMNEIAADAAKLGNSGKDAQKLMADFQRLASSGDLSGQQATLAEMGSKLELLLNNGTFDKTQYDTLSKILEHMNSMAGYQLRAKDNEAKITEIDQKIAQIETLPILKRNLLADESGSQAMAEVYSSHLKGLQQQVEAGSEAERAVADSLNDLSDGYLDTQEAQRMADNAERLLQSHDAAAQQIGGFLKTVVSSYGEASSILQDTRFQVSSARAQMESIRAKNNQAYTAK
ncbi:hypothetical protein [Akkermansia glycaniphila]|nr:hypothetical protein [Akkermansia glycaniphila]